MSESKVLIHVEIVNNKIKVTLGTRHEAILCLALRKAELAVMDSLLANEVFEEPVIIQQKDIQIPKDIIKQM